MRVRFALGATLAAALLAGSVIAAHALESGPQPGKHVGAFDPLHVNGPAAGKKVCLVWKNGNNPVAMIFAREVSDPLVSLIKAVDKATEEHKDQRMGSFVVFLTDDTEAMKKRLKEVADQQHLKHTVLSIFDTSGPEGYKVSPDADVTAVLYVKHTVKENFAFKKGEFTDADVTKIVDNIPKILPEKK